MFNFVTELIKKNININSTLFISQDELQYIKLLYNNQRIVFKFGLMMHEYPTHDVYINEIIASTTETLLNRTNVISFYHSVAPQRTLVIVNDTEIYNKNNLSIGGNVYKYDEATDSMVNSNMSIFKNHQFYHFYLCNTSDSRQSFNGKFYYCSCLQNTTEDEAKQLHKYYKYIHNI